LELRCPFAKVLLGGFCGCTSSTRSMEGGHKSVFCSAPPANRNCIALVQRLRGHTTFALNLRRVAEPLPFGKESRLLVGTVEGLRRLPASDAGLNSDIHGLVSAAHAFHGPRFASPRGNRAIDRRV
jgi:hypothetical protein